MKLLQNFDDYSLIATGNGMKLERFYSVVLLRNDPQITWKAPFNLYSYNDLNAIHIKKSGRKSYWMIKKEFEEEFVLNWRNLKFILSLKDFKHIGIFPEQAINWEKIINVIKESQREIKVLNLFAYTGGATLAALTAGGRVCHVDALKSACNTAKQNVIQSNLDITKVRFIVDDCVKFVKREIKRGNRYDAVIMDPPSFGRGPKGQLWKIQDMLPDILELVKQVLSPNMLFCLINTYTKGLNPEKIINKAFLAYKTKSQSYELGIKGQDNRILPCGNSVFLEFI